MSDNKEPRPDELPVLYRTVLQMRSVGWDKSRQQIRHPRWAYLPGPPFRHLRR